MDAKLKIAGIIKESIVDGEGIRLVVFGQGCPHNCKGCQNPSTHLEDGGSLVDIDEIIELAKKNPLLDGITFSGGEPFSQADKFSLLAKKAKSIGLNIVVYTGYTYEFLFENSFKRRDWASLLEEADILIDGRFEIEKKNLLLKFRGSENQRIIDMNKTSAQGKVVLADV